MKTTQLPMAISEQYEKKYTNISTIYKLTDSDYEMISYPSNWLEMCHYEDNPIRLDDFQHATINSTATWNYTVKARQLGYSTFCVAGRAVAYSHMIRNHKSVICSYNLGEAKEKIKLARIILEGVPGKLQRKLTKNSAFELEFDNGSRILSVFTPRGYNNSDIYLDEFPFMADQQELYRASVPIIKRQIDKQLFIGGTPFGKLGIFFDIIDQTGGKYTNYNTFIWFWWDSPFYSKDVNIARHGDFANKLLPAHMMSTPDRVYTYGTPALIDIYEQMQMEDFQQEYEAYFCDESTSYFPYDMILRRMKSFDHTEQKTFPKSLEEIGMWAKGTLYAGIDIGRKKHASEFFVFDLRDEDIGYSSPKFIQVYKKTLHKTPFSTQEAFFRKFLEMYGDRTGIVGVDSNGIGMHLAENLSEDYPYQIDPVEFGPKVKAEMASSTRIFFEDEILELWPDRDVMKQIHSIKKVVGLTGVTKYDVDRNEKHHADQFWAIALACNSANNDRGIRSHFFVPR